MAVTTTKFKMAATETGRGNNTVVRNELATRFQRYTPRFATMRDTSLTLPTLADVGYQSTSANVEFKTATTKSEVEITFQL